MEESKDLKAGETTSYQIGGQTVMLKPVTLGKMKRAMAAFANKGDAFEMLRDYLVIILDNGANSFATPEWIDDNIDLPTATRMIDDSRRINGMDNKDFFRLGAADTNGKVTKDLPLPATPSV